MSSLLTTSIWLLFCATYRRCRLGFGGGGVPAEPRTINYKDHGTHLTVTPQVQPDKLITLEVKLRDVVAVHPAEGIVVGMDEKGEATTAQETVVTALECKLSVQSGRAVVESSWR